MSILSAITCHLIGQYLPSLPMERDGICGSSRLADALQRFHREGALSRFFLHNHHHLGSTSCRESATTSLYPNTSHRTLLSAASRLLQTKVRSDNHSISPTMTLNPDLQLLPRPKSSITTSCISSASRILRITDCILVLLLTDTSSPYSPSI